MVTLEELVPKDHLLRKIDAVIDFSFIHAVTAPLYCADNGRPPLDPTLMFKALFVGYLFGVRSERQLVREIQVNVAYRWFLGLKLTDPVFDASTLSQNRRRRYNDTAVAQEIFDKVVEQAIAHGLVDGTVLYTDSTHLKANANKNKYDLAVVAKSRADYWDALDAAVEAERAELGRKPLKARERSAPEAQTKVSRTDADSGYMVRDGKPKGFFYLDHRTVDGRLGIITDTYTTPGNVHDSIVYLSRLDRQRDRFDFDVAAVGLDAGYATAGIAQGLEERQIMGITGYRNPTPPKPGMMRKTRFAWEAEANGYRCPEGQLLGYASTDRSGYRLYKSDPAICRACPLLASCTSAQKPQRVITRHIWQDARDRADALRLTPHGKTIYKRRKETVERSFADAKQLHGHRYARFRGRTRVACQCLLAAAAQNIKKIALTMTRSWVLHPA
jgi:transposase